MTNQHSTTGERERIARALYEAMPVRWNQPSKDDVWTVIPWDDIKTEDPERAARAYREADAILSRPSRMAASSEGEPVSWVRSAFVREVKAILKASLNDHDMAANCIANIVETVFAAGPTASTPSIAVPVSEEMVEAAAREFSGAPFPSHRSITRARAALTAALAVPDKGVQG